MKKKVQITAKKDMGVLFALCLLGVGISLIYVISQWAIEFWGLVLAESTFAAILCLVAMRIGLTVDTEKRVIIRRTLFKKTEINFENIYRVEIRKVFLGKAIVIIDNGGRIFDKTRIGFFKYNYIIPENFVTYFSSRSYYSELLAPSEKLMKKQATVSRVALILVAIFELVPLILIEITRNPPKYPIVDIKPYEYASFWVILGIALVTVIGLLVKNKHNPVRDFIMMLLCFSYVPLMFVAGLGTREDYFVSHTDDFANYHDIMNDEWDGDYMHFPKEVKGEVIDFSYYYKYYWDSIWEIYLEVKYSDEEFERIYSEYEVKESSYFGEQYEEVNLGEEYFSADEYEGDVWIAGGSCGKIIFDKSNNTIIYYYLSATDPLDLEWCKLVNKFDIDVFDYEEYTKAKRESNKENITEK